MTTRTDYQSKTHSTPTNILKHIETAKRHVPAHRPCVLIVEDHDETALLMEYALHRRYRIEVVSSAEAAMQKTASTTYDGFLIDISLPSQRNGIDVLEALRAQPAHRQAPVVAVTAHALPGDRERFLAAGFDEYLSKPFTTSGLRAIVHREIPSRRPAPSPYSGQDPVLTKVEVES